jgi:hypothetical protein
MTFPNTENDTPLLNENEGEGEDAQTPETGGGLRAKYEDALERIKELEGTHTVETEDLSERLMAQEFDRLGLDKDKVIGKAAHQTFDGPPEGLAEYVAVEYEHYGTAHPMQQAITNSQAAPDAIGQTAGSIAPPTEQERI